MQPGDGRRHEHVHGLADCLGRGVAEEPLGGRVPAPDLAVEVLSDSNTKAEMDRKLREYFESGTRLVWYVDPETRTISVYTSPLTVSVLVADEILDGGVVLPGFMVRVGSVFEEADESFAE